MATSSRELALLDCASQLLSEATSLDDVKEVRDAAEAARTFAKAARLGLDLQNRAAELKLRAERKAGAFLAELHLKGGDRRSTGRRAALKLEDLGVTKQQSKRWQLAALVPEREFEQYLRGRNQLGEEVTAAGLLRLARTMQPKRESSVRPPFRDAEPPSRETVVAGRAELLSLVSELKCQCQHLRALLEPFVAGDKAVYQTPERRFIGRLTREVEIGVMEIEKNLWKIG